MAISAIFPAIQPSSKKDNIQLGIKAAVLGGALSTLFIAAPILAQQPGQQARLEEIVVTARRREERLQDVPITVNTFSGEYLRASGINNFDDVQYHTPAMNIVYNSADTIEPRIALRGIIPFESRLADDPSAPVYFSEVVLTPPTGLNLALYDLASVEVLKGPQGTLFGRNSTAGALLINPRLPGEEFGGFVDVALGNYNMHRVDFGVDVPVSDNFQVRLAGRQTERDGFQTNRNDQPGFERDFGKKLWNDNTKALRLSARWNITDDIENITVADWGRKTSRSRAAKAIATGLPPFEPNIDRNLALRNPHDVRISAVGPENVEHTFLANTTTWRLGDIILKNILGYRNSRSRRVFDLDGMDRIVIESAPGGSDTAGADQYSIEFQALGTAMNERLDWVAGLYYYDMDGSATQNPVTQNGTLESVDYKSESYAIFAQGTYDFDNPWSLTLGARQSWDKRDIDLTTFHGTLTPNPFCALLDSGPDCTLSNSESFDKATWHASLAYNFSDDVMAYATVGTGYKAGGFNSRASSSAALSPFEEETVLSYEIGLKAEWLMGSWQVRSNLSAYYMDYEDIQVAVSECLDLGGEFCQIVSNKKNAGEARYRGMELQFTVVPTDNLQLDIGYSHVDPKYKKWDDIDSQGNPIDRSDTLFPLQPDNEFNAALRYTIPLASDIGDLTLNANVVWRDDQVLTLDPNVLLDSRFRDVAIQKSYHLIDLRADWSSVMGSKFDLSLFVKNLEDKTHVVSRSDQLREGRNLFMAHIYGEPRTVGAAIRYSF